MHVHIHARGKEQPSREHKEAGPHNRLQTSQLIHRKKQGRLEIEQKDRKQVYHKTHSQHKSIKGEIPPN